MDNYPDKRSGPILITAVHFSAPAEEERDQISVVLTSRPTSPENIFNDKIDHSYSSRNLINLRLFQRPTRIYSVPGDLTCAVVESLSVRTAPALSKISVIST